MINSQDRSYCPALNEIEEYVGNPCALSIP